VCEILTLHFTANVSFLCIVFVVYIPVTTSPPSSTSGTAFPVVPVAAGVAAVAVLIVVAIIVVIYCCRLRTNRKRPTSSRAFSSINHVSLNSFSSVFARTGDAAVPAGGDGDLRALVCVLVAGPGRCLALSGPVP